MAYKVICARPDGGRKGDMGHKHLALVLQQLSFLRSAVGSRSGGMTHALPVPSRQNPPRQAPLQNHSIDPELQPLGDVIRENCARRKNQAAL